MLGLLPLVIAFQSCTKMSFSGGEEPSLVQENNTPQDLGPTLCDPFGNGDGGDRKSGLYGRVRYLSPQNEDRWLRSRTMYDYYNPAWSYDLGYALIMRTVNVPNREFRDGFPIGNGQYFRDSNGNLITEWFSIMVEGKVRLRPNEAEGPYRFAVRSDDASILQVRYEAGGEYQTILNDDYQGDFSNLKSADVNVDMARGKLLDIKLWYYQGPGGQMGVELMWRRDDNSDSLRVLTAENLVLPDGIENPCLTNQ